MITEIKSKRRPCRVTHPQLFAFNTWARRHYGSQEALAEALMTCRTHLSQIIVGTRPGLHTWKRLVRILPEEGLSLLRQCPSWNNHAEAALKARREREQFADRFGEKQKPKEEPCKN